MSVLTPYLVSEDEQHSSGNRNLNVDEVYDINNVRALLDGDELSAIRSCDEIQKDSQGFSGRGLLWRMRKLGWYRIVGHL